MRQTFLLLVLWSFAFPAMTQTVQWANEVISFSSQYEDDYYAAHQALGVPNALTNERLNYMAWVPKKEESMVGEYLQVGFKTAMQIQQVAVAESLNPGAIYRISAFDRDGKKHVIYEQKGVKATMKPARIFRHKFPLTEYYVKSIKLELNTKAVPGSNQIDAIAISDSADDIKPRVSVLRYEDEVAQPEELGVAVNSIYSERLPIITPDGQTLFFTRKEHPKNIGADNKDDIWVSYRQKDDTWSPAVNIGIPLNNDDHNFVVATDPSSKQLYLGNDYDKSAEGVSISKKEGRSWSKPKGIKIEDHYNDSPFVGYHINIDGDVLLMSVQRKEGFGERDFYVSFKRKNNEWTKPKNLGPTINTVNTENSIFLAADNRTIYFSSNGHAGYGGFDMFMSRRLDNSWTKWSKPKNLGKKINSKENDFNYTIPASGEYAYFSSGSMDDSDLYRIKLPKEVQPKPVALVKARLVDAETGELVEGKISVQKIGNKNKKTKSSQSDEHQIVLPFGSDMGIYAERDGYFSVSENVALSDSKFKELDGNGPPPATKTSSVDNDEIDRLQLKLKELKKELARLEKKRDQVQSTPSITTKQVSSEDAELEQLRNRFNDLSDNDIDDKKVKEEDNSGDAELDALRKRFNQHYNKEHSNTSSKEDANKSTANNEEVEEDDELAEMKRRLNQHYNKKETPKKEEEPSKVAETVQEEKTETEDATFVDFEAYQKDIRHELTIELTPQIKKELHKELFAEAKRDLNVSVRSKLTPEIEASVKKQLRKNLEKVSTTNYEPQVSEKERANISPLIEEELRDNLGNKLDKELRLSLKEPIKTEIQQEMEYAIKRSAEKEVRTELQQQLKQQAKVEKEQTVAATPKETEQEIEEDTPSEPAYKEVEKDILLVPIKIGQIIPMNNIFFAANESKLKKESFGELDRVLAFLEENPNLIVEVGGHTNGWCSHEFAHELSTDRSKVVMNYFLSKGVSAKRIQNRGYGKTNPVATNDTRAGRSKNQRVELKILEIK